MNWHDIIASYRYAISHNNNLALITKPTRIEEVIITLLALINAGGGVLIAGIDFKNFHLQGCGIDTDVLQDILNKKNLPLALQIVKRNDKHIIHAVATHSHQNQYLYEGIVYQWCDQKIQIEMASQTLHLVEVMATEAIVEQQLFEQESITPAQPSTAEAPTRTYMHSTFQIKKTNEFATLNLFPLQACDHEFEKQSQQIRVLNARQQKALSYIKRHKKIQNKEYQSIGQVSHKTAHLELIEMVMYDILKPIGSGRSRHYVLNPAFFSSLN